ncbi:MAG: GNAT family N-acetyltransferase [Hyphomicrobiaceae bacterium]
MSVRIERLTGAALGCGLDAVARLRMTVFREWPYLYDGDLDYECDYLAGFAAGAGSIIVTANDADDIVGAATAAALAEHTEDFGPLLERHGWPPDDIFYLGESVLLSAYRGAGIGHAFFDHREAHARDLMAGGSYNFTHFAFCGVVREPLDPRRPVDYRPLDPFWENRGYDRVEGLIGHYDWLEIGAQTETRHAMQFWARKLEN